MRSPTLGWARLVRVGALGGSSLLLAAGAHLAGGGRLPGLGVMLLLTAALAAVAAGLTARRCRLPRLLAVLLAEQLALHAVFGASTPTGHPMPSGHGAGLCDTGLLQAAQLAHAGPHCPLSMVMLFAHLVATVLAAWVLTRGEAALWRLADRIARAARPPQASWPVAAPPARTPDSSSLAHLLLGDDDAAPRAPPVIAAAVG